MAHTVTTAALLNPAKARQGRPPSRQGRQHQQPHQIHRQPAADKQNQGDE